MFLDFVFFMDTSHNPNRRIFESSLEIKCLFFFGLALTVVIGASFRLYFYVTEAQIKAQNPQTANLLVEQDMMLKHYGMLNSKERKFDEYLSDMMTSIIDGLRQESFQSRVIRSPYYHNNYWKAGSEESMNPANEYEQKLLDRFLVVPEGFQPNGKYDNDYVDRIDNQTEEYHYYRPVRMNSMNCTICHKTEDYDEPRLGDLIAIVHVTIPKPPAQNAVAKNWAWLLSVSIVTAFLSLIAVYAVIRWVIIKPLRSLRDVSEAISRGDVTLRADLHTGDEFETLGAAFNRMLRHLVSTQEKLKGANIELEYKVDQLATIMMQLHETNRIKSDFMATMSHELRTPLNSILGFSDVLGSISTLDDKQKRYVENIGKSGRTLLNMINDILDMAKIEAGRMDIKIQKFQIEHIIVAQTDMARPLLDKKNIDIDIDIEPGLPPMSQDASRIQQILNNLLSNAIKFTPEGGRIKISVRQTELSLPIIHHPEEGTSPSLTLHPKPVPFLELKVSDTGVGISEDDQQIVFEKFRQARSMKTGDNTMKREYSGSGLGLSIVKELCRMLEGEIELESRLGLGSTFTIHLPWNLDAKPHSESEMMAEIQQFTKTRIKSGP
ncbi:MAG: ATP-binding protein [Planctomycetaceae bacterium]|nr:ATP-binding protein [Planctomycetaceae bacterium]